MGVYNYILPVGGAVIQGEGGSGEDAQHCVVEGTGMHCHSRDGWGTGDKDKDIGHEEVWEQGAGRCPDIVEGGMAPPHLGNHWGSQGEGEAGAWPHATPGEEGGGAR